MPTVRFVLSARIALFALTASLVLGACVSGPPPVGKGVDNVLGDAETMELYTLATDPSVSGGERFYGHKIIGTSPITDPGERKQLVSEFYRGLRSATGAVPAGEVTPRFGLRAVRGEAGVDLLIDFTDQKVLIYRILPDDPPAKTKEEAPQPEYKKTTNDPVLVFLEIAAKHGLSVDE